MRLRQTGRCRSTSHTLATVLLAVGQVNAEPAILRQDMLLAEAARQRGTVVEVAIGHQARNNSCLRAG